MRKEGTFLTMNMLCISELSIAIFYFSQRVCWAFLEFEFIVKCLFLKRFVRAPWKLIALRIFWLFHKNFCVLLIFQVRISVPALKKVRLPLKFIMAIYLIVYWLSRLLIHWSKCWTSYLALLEYISDAPFCLWRCWSRPLGVWPKLLSKKFKAPEVFIQINYKRISIKGRYMQYFFKILLYCLQRSDAKVEFC